MHGDIRSRLAVLLVLAVFGVAVAGAGTTLGEATVTSADADARFVVSEENVTFATERGEVTVTDEMSNVTSVRVQEAESGQFRVETERAQPLTGADRAHAKRIVRRNETVQTFLTEGDYTLGVDAIRRFDTTDIQVSGNVTEINESGNVSVMTFEVENETRDTAGGSVVIDREPAYVPERAAVKIRDPNASERTDLKYSVGVDLANETVTDITNWTAIRQESPTITGTRVEESDRR